MSTSPDLDEIQRLTVANAQLENDLAIVRDAYTSLCHQLSDAARKRGYDESAARQDERDRCRKDVCFYCRGDTPQYHTLPDGPNDAGDYEHARKDHKGPALCKATGILARERFMQDQPRRLDGNESEGGE